MFCLTISGIDNVKYKGGICFRLLQTILIPQLGVSFVNQNKETLHSVVLFCYFEAFYYQ